MKKSFSFAKPTKLIKKFFYSEEKFEKCGLATFDRGPYIYYELYQ